jgi:hypothetical protein
MAEGAVTDGARTTSRSRSGRPLQRYRVFGLTLETDFEFETPLPTSTQAPDLRFHLLGSPTDRVEPACAGTTIFESPLRIASGLPLIEVQRLPEGDLVRFSEVADFLVLDDRIVAFLLDAEYRFMVEIHLLGVVLSYWFERRRIPMLHAAAVAVSGNAVAFLATNRGGKSSLALSLMRRGHPLLADDLVGLTTDETGVGVRPGFPSMRMWPDLASEILGEAWEAMPLAHPAYDKRRVPVGPGGFGQFLDRPCPLTRVYLPERRDPEKHGLHVTIEAMPAAQAIFELLRGSFLPRLTQASGLAAGRMKVFGDLAGRVPVRRLVYPSGFEHLARVSQRILDDLEGDPHGSRIAES